MTEQVLVTACSNVALVKYWGKLDPVTNQPATGSLSIGLDALRTTTQVALLSGADDELAINDIQSGKAIDRVRAFLALCRRRYGFEQHFSVTTHNNFPTGAGLASSASGFAALGLAINKLMALALPAKQLSQLARRGSGSAARSVFGGFVEVVLAADAFARPLAPAEHWPLSVVLAITDASEKAVGSGEAMLRTAATSPCYQGWLDSHPDDLLQARQAIANRDFELLARVSEANCLKMHAAIMTSSPPILYWLPATLALMHKIRQLRAAGWPVFFTIDAGAQMKAVCLAGSEETLERELQQVPGVLSTIKSPVGGAPCVQCLS